MSSLEGLVIYKQYLEMIYYTEMITEKYPKVEKYSLVSEIKKTTYKGMDLVIRGEREFVKSKKISNIGNLLGGWINSCRRV